MVRNKIKGTRDNDTLLGTDGRDAIRGRAGDDVIDGGSGKDRIVGGRGDDIMTGGEDADRFVFKGESGHDVITDFDLAEDRLVFRGTGFDNLDSILTNLDDTEDGVRLEYDGGSVLLQGVTAAELSEAFNDGWWIVS